MKKSKNKEFIRPVSTAPQWLIEQMERLHKLPPPSIDEVIAQFKGSSEQRKKMGFNI